MRYASAIFGIVGSLFCITHVHAQQGLGGLQLYERMHNLTTQGITLANTNDGALVKGDNGLAEYITSIFLQENSNTLEKTSAEMRPIVQAAIEGQLDEFCKLYNNTFDGCPQVYQMIRDLALDAMDTGELLVDLNNIVVGYETGVSGKMGEIFDVTERTLTIRNLWRSQDDVLLTPEVFPLIRAVPRPDSVADGMFDELGKEIKQGGVWRYHYGLAQFDTIACSDFDESHDDNTELYRAIHMRFCKLEDKLRAIRDALPSSALDFTPPLQRGEIAIFPLRRLDDPPHVIVWMMAENVDGTVKRDVGLGWDLMLATGPLVIAGYNPPCDSEKLNSAYCSVVERFAVRPGGRYEDPPEEPSEEAGICHLPFARDGYMCRPMRHDRCNAEIDEKDPRAIVLTECKPTQAKQPVALTESGPDICRTGWWRIPTNNEELAKDTSEENPDLRPGACSNCAVDIVCSEHCGGIDGFDSQTMPKDENGVIKICLSRRNPPPLMASGLIHELTHAQQLCPLQPEDAPTDAETCCALEAEAYRASCRILATNGLLDSAGISLEECIGVGANMSCTHLGEATCSSLDTESVWDKLMLAARKDTSSYPSCDELVNDMINKEPLAVAMKEGMNGACSPGCPTKYENTIGNNLCYIGQCVEQSIEQSRVIPGRMGFVVEDEAFPWDSCAVENTEAGGLIALPAISPPLIPAYNPRLLIESLDRALCQINGLPAATPPILCQFNYERRLNIPTESYVTTAFSFAGQIEENLEPAVLLERMTQSIATRIGTSLLARYLEWSAGALSDTLRAGNQLLGAMAKTEFPRETCPRNAAEIPDFCNASPYVPE
ncbi:hypothetical protein AUJ46_03370 [Candidatus Peregrinibacteria bacterium CG1_02_54_53]|nr:MAG: hypothetical protein AUJ46_03370 [Candidatus Peregrinibacteria bacterium CG1_02_54_53]